MLRKSFRNLGSYGITGNLSPFGTSWSGAVEGSTFMVGYGRMDNTITYKSPEFAGVRVYAQYSFDGNTKDEWTDTWDGGNKSASVKGSEGKTTATRYAALGATYGIGGLNLVASFDWYNWSKNWLYDGQTKGYESGDIDDGYAITLGGSYDFQVVKAYLGAQYYDNMIAGSSNADEAIDLAKIGFGTNEQFKGYSIMAGVYAPVFGGTAMFAAGYADVEAVDADKDEYNGKNPEMSRWGVAAGYQYALSKRTNVYGVAAYYQDSFDNYNKDADGKLYNNEPSTATLFVGMRHKF